MKRAALVITLVALVACDRFDFNRETYEDAGTARRMGAFDRGLIPAFVPDDARNIASASNRRTRDAWLRCELPEHAMASVSDSVQHVGWAEARAHAVAAPDWLGEWHPVLGRDPLASMPDATSTYFVYRDTAGEWHGVITAGRKCFAYRLPLH